MKKVDPQIAFWSQELIYKHAEQGRADKVGKFLKPINHNYLYGYTLLELVERITHFVKREHQTLDQIWKDVRWMNPENRGLALALSKMGLN